MENNVQIFNGNEEIFKRSVALYFGGASTEEEREKLDKRAIEWDFSMTRLINEGFRELISSLSKRNGSDENFFDLCCFIFSEIPNVRSPSARVESYAHKGSKYPMLVFEDGYLSDANGVKRFFLRDHVIDGIGQIIEEEFSVEYFEFERLGLS